MAHYEAVRDKRRRLTRLVGVKHATPAVISEIMARLADTALPPTSAWVLRNIVRSEFTQLGMEIELPYENSDRTFTWHVLRLDKVLQRFADASAVFRGVLLRAARGRHGQLRLCFYTDEVTPGNVLALVVGRKFWAFYFSFFEFGLLLQKESFWIPIAVLRTHIANEIVGGVSGCIARLLHAIFGPPTNLRHGFVLNLPEAIMISATFHILLADGEADRACWSCKGAAGIRSCFVCRNCIKHRYSNHPGVHPVSCADFALFDVADDNSVWESADILSAAAETTPKPQFELLQRSLGLTHRPGTLLQDRSLRDIVKPVSSHRYGPMHTLVHNGVATYEFARFFRACQQKLPSFSYEQVREFLRADWHHPHNAGAKVSSMSRIRNMFAKKREKDLASLTFKATASDILEVYPLIRMFGHVCVRPLGLLSRELDSLEAVCVVLDCYVATKRGEKVVGFAAAVSAALECHATVYGPEDMKPKHHWSHHLPRQYEEDDDVLIDEFALERKHKGIKAFAESLFNTLAFERTLIANAVLDQERSLIDIIIDDHLRVPIGTCPALSQAFQGSDVHVSQSMVARSTCITVGDIVFIDGIAVLVASCAQVDKQFCIVGYEMDFSAKTSKSSSTWRDPHTKLTVALMSEHTLSIPHAWTVLGDHTYEILHR